VKADDLWLEGQHEFQPLLVEAKAWVGEFVRWIPQTQLVVPGLQALSCAVENRWIGVNGLDDKEIQVEGAVGSRADRFSVLPYGVGRLLTAAEGPEAAGIGNRSHQDGPGNFSRANRTHCPLQNGVSYSQHVT